LKQNRSQRIVTILISILIAGNLLVGCSSSKPESENNVVTTQQQKQEKIDTENKVKEEAELKTQLEAKQKAQLEAEETARIIAEEKAKKETEARVQEQAQIKAQQESIQKASEAQKISTTVYITKTGEKYHKDGCKYLSKSKIAISLENARSSYSPCSVCNPPQ